MISMMRGMRASRVNSAILMNMRFLLGELRFGHLDAYARAMDSNLVEWDLVPKECIENDDGSEALMKHSCFIDLIVMLRLMIDLIFHIRIPLNHMTASVGRLTVFS